MYFLEKKVSTYAAVNKMSVTNLSIVFGPLYLHTADATMETLLQMPTINHITKLLIEHSDYFFTEA